MPSQCILPDLQPHTSATHLSKFKPTAWHVPPPCFTLCCVLLASLRLLKTTWTLLSSTIPTPWTSEGEPTPCIHHFITWEMTYAGWWGTICSFNRYIHLQSALCTSMHLCPTLTLLSTPHDDWLHTTRQHTHKTTSSTGDLQSRFQCGLVNEQPGGNTGCCYQVAVDIVTVAGASILLLCQV